jgi:hypothetical protein
LTEADAWTHYRVKKLKFRLVPFTPHVGLLAVGYVGGIQDTPPATVAAILELLPASLIGPTQTVYTQWISPSKSELAGPLPWYKTIQGTADSTEEAPGQVALAGTVADGYAVELSGVLEFKGSVATANTPAALKVREELRALRQSRIDALEKERLLSVIGSTKTAK